MDEHGELEKNDLVLAEDTNDNYSGRAGRVVEEYNSIVDVQFVIPETGEIVQKTYDRENLGLVWSAGLPTTTQLLIEKCCSGCKKLSWDNRTGGYSEKHHVVATNIDVLCDYDGRTYINGDLVPPKIEA